MIIGITFKDIFFVATAGALAGFVTGIIFTKKILNKRSEDTSKIA